MFSARPYQVESIASLHEGWLDPAVKNQLVCMATGCGKTVVFSLLAAEVATSGKRALILAHTDELIDQAIDKFQRATGMRAGREKAESYAGRHQKVVVASVQTMQGDLRLSSWPKNWFDVVIVDEAHRSLADGYQKVLKHFAAGGARIVGVTATADRGDKRALGEFFHRVAYDYGLLRAVRDGWLVRPIVKTMPLPPIDVSGVAMQQTSDGADLNRIEVGKRISPYIDRIAQAMKAEIAGEKILIFLPSVETAQMMAASLVKVGVSADWVCGDKKICPDRKQRVERHKRGEFQALTNMAVLTEGYDDDTIRNVACLRATKIRSLYCQIIGRGTRPLGSIVPRLNAAANAQERVEIIRSSEKPFVRVLDFLWAYKNHDLCTPASLVSQSEEVKEATAGLDGDIIEAAERAERDLLAKLEKEVKKNANRKQVVIDPLGLAEELGDPTIANYEPETDREARPASENQLRILKNNGISPEAVKSHGHAHKLIDAIIGRHNKGLCTLRQLNFFKKIGVDASTWTKEYASERQKEQLEKWRKRDEAKKAAKAAAEEVARDLDCSVEELFAPESIGVRSLLDEPGSAADPDAEIDDLTGLFDVEAVA